MTSDIHKHLHRLTQIYVKDPVYFITTNISERKPILATSEAEEILLCEWRDSLHRHGWAIGRYVIMPDHVHFFCRPTQTAVDLSSFMNRWKEWTSKKLSRRLSVSVPIWQPEFFDHLLRSEESYSEKWLYVRNNPVRAGLVQTVEDWKYQGFVHFP